MFTGSILENVRGGIWMRIGAHGNEKEFGREISREGRKSVVNGRGEGIKKGRGPRVVRGR